VEICKKAKKTKSKRDTATVEWLIQEYQSMWTDAMKLGTVEGAPPKQCDILHHLALHVEYLNEWASHSGPIPTSVWREFAVQVLPARESAKEHGIRWGIFPEVNETIQEQEQEETILRRSAVVAHTVPPVSIFTYLSTEPNCLVILDPGHPG
jgi:hypothetical protein